MTTSTPEAADGTPADPVAPPAGPFTGLSVIITGDIEGWTRDTVNAAIAKMGGKPVSSISGKTGLVIMGEGAGVSKMGKTRDHNLNVIDAEAFLALTDAFRAGTWDGQPVGEPIKAYDARTDPDPEPDPITLIPFNERHLVGKAHGSSANSAGRLVREIRQWCSCGHGWLGRSPEGEPCPVEVGVCGPQPLWPWDEPGYEPFWPPRESDAAPAEFYEALAVIEAERVAALPPSVLGSSALSPEEMASTVVAAPPVAAEPTPAPTPAPEPEPVVAAPPAMPSPSPEPTEPIKDPVPTPEPTQPVDDFWPTDVVPRRGTKVFVDNDWPTGDDVAAAFDDSDDDFDPDAWDTAPAATPAPEPVAVAEPPAPVEPPAPTREFRRLTTHDVDDMLALRGVTEPAQEEKILATALLNSAATQTHGIFETIYDADGAGQTRLLAAAAILTDGLTKAVLTDIAVAADQRAAGMGAALGDEVVGSALATLPDHVQGIVFCRADKTGTYTEHGFEAEDGFTVLFR